MDEKVRQRITREIGTLRALEDDGARAIARQIDAMRGTSQPEVLRALEDFKRSLESHVSELDARLSALGGSPAPPVQPASSATGALAGLFGSPSRMPASKMLRDDYGFLSFDAMTYLMLHTTALSLGDVDTASLVERGYRDCARMVIEIDRIIPDVVLNELLREGYAAKDITAECRRLVASSWRRQPPSVATRKAV